MYVLAFRPLNIFSLKATTKHLVSVHITFTECGMTHSLDSCGLWLVYLLSAFAADGEKTPFQGSILRYFNYSHLPCLWWIATYSTQLLDQWLVSLGLNTWPCCTYMYLQQGLRIFFPSYPCSHDTRNHSWNSSEAISKWFNVHVNSKSVLGTVPIKNS